MQSFLDANAFQMTRHMVW